MPSTLSSRGLFRIKTLAPGVRSVRFIEPDLINILRHIEPPTDSSLYHDFEESILASLRPGETVVLNFRRIRPFGSAFYRHLLALRDAVRARRARLLLCRLGPNVQECFDILHGHRIFTIVRGERAALRVARLDLPAAVKRS